MQTINAFLDRYVLPWPVRFLTNRFVILGTGALLIPLIVFASATVFVLGINSYLNTTSVAVSSIVLLYATISEVRDKQVAEMQERRAQEDHAHVVEMHQLVIDTLRLQHEEVQDLKEIIADLQGKKVVRQENPIKEGLDLHGLHPRGLERFAEDDAARRVGRHSRTLMAGNTG